MDNQKKAIETVKNITPEAETFRLISYHLEYLNGALYVVGFDTDDGPKHNYVYIENGEASVYRNEALLNELVARKSKKSGFASILDSIGGIAGIIGLIITLTIVYLVVSKPDTDIPQILSTGLTAILGFYFGSKTSK